MSGEARFVGVCAKCDRGYPEGTEIESTPGGEWGHVRCPRPPAVLHPVCLICFIEHPVGDEC